MNNVLDIKRSKYENLRDLRISVSITKEIADFGAYDRIAEIADEGSFREFDGTFEAIDPLDFDGYLEKKDRLKEEKGIAEAFVFGVCTIDGVECVLGVMDKRFLMGSMGVELGERVSLATEYAYFNNLPLILFTASGGARMQEGIMSLMQMAKTSAVIEKFKKAGGLYIAVLTHPTTGGVSASFASLGDITLAEPGALIGFAGPRVIEQTIKETLPEGFQSAEFQMEHGFVDEVVEREKMKDRLSLLLRLHYRAR